MQPEGRELDSTGLPSHIPSLSSPCKHLDHAPPCRSILGCFSCYMEFTPLSDSITTEDLHVFDLQVALV